MEKVIEQVMSIAPDAVTVIKSNVPVGYTMSVREKYGTDRIVFSPEFLREGRALYDNLYTGRIIVGAPEKPAEIKVKCVKVVVYEPTLDKRDFFNSEVVRGLERFLSMCDVIIANRYNDELSEVMDKVYIRDLFFRD